MTARMATSIRSTAASVFGSWGMADQTDATALALTRKARDAYRRGLDVMARGQP